MRVGRGAACTPNWLRRRRAQGFCGVYVPPLDWEGLRSASPDGRPGIMLRAESWALSNAMVWRVFALGPGSARIWLETRRRRRRSPESRQPRLAAVTGGIWLKLPAQATSGRMRPFSDNDRAVGGELLRLSFADRRAAPACRSLSTAQAVALADRPSDGAGASAAARWLWTPWE